MLVHDLASSKVLVVKVHHTHWLFGGDVKHLALIFQFSKLSMTFLCLLLELL